MNLFKNPCNDREFSIFGFHAGFSPSGQHLLIMGSGGSVGIFSLHLT